MGSAASNFLEPPSKRHHRRKDTDGGATKSFKFFMRHLRKLLKQKKPHLTKPEVKLLGKVLWGELAPEQRRVFAVELAKKTRKKLGAKKRTSAGSRLSTLFDSRVKRMRRKKPPVIVHETLHGKDQQAGPSGHNLHPAPPPPTTKQESPPPAAFLSVPPSLPRAFSHRSSRIYTMLSTAVSRHYAERRGPGAQATERRGPRPQTTEGRGLRPQATEPRGSKPQQNARRSLKPQMTLATAVSRHLGGGEMEVDDDSGSDYEGGYLYSGASTTSMSSTLVSSEKGEK